MVEYADNRGVALRVDREANVIRGVKILGLESRNGRTYTRESVAQAASLYEGARVNVDHAGKPSEPRGYRDRLGAVKNVTQSSDGGLYGDFHFNPKHPVAEQLLWDAEHSPESVGFSHNVEAKTRHEAGRVVVEAITKVASVDLVADPATTKSLYESEHPAMSKTAREILSEQYGERAANWLKEEADMLADSPVDAPASMDANDQIKGAFRAMVMAAFDDDKLDAKATVKKIAEILKAQEKLMSGGTPEKSEEPKEEPKDDAPATEALQAKVKSLTEQLAKIENEKRVAEKLRAAKLTLDAVPAVFREQLMNADAATQDRMIESLAPLVQPRFSAPVSRDWNGSSNGDVKLEELFA